MGNVDEDVLGEQVWEDVWLDMLVGIFGVVIL